MAKRAKGKGYVSNGERRNLGRKIRNELRRERRANPTIESILAKAKHRRDILEKKGYSLLKEELLKKIDIEKRSLALYNKYKNKGVSWASCIQAVKTDWVPQFETKWHNIAM